MVLTFASPQEFPAGSLFFPGWTQGPDRLSAAQGRGMSDDEQSGSAKGESKVEQTKRAGHYLRGTIAESLRDGGTHFGGDDVSLLKFHGTYQQDNRDARRGRGEGQEKAYSFMVRLAIPAGVLTAAQYLAVDELAGQYADGTLRVTTRQAFQLHGVLKGNLRATIAAINDALLSTLAACGDVERNVLACPAPSDDAAHVAVREAARAIARELRPATRAYHEIWVDGEPVVNTAVEEPFYGAQYLPRKFKTAVALATDNCVDAHAQDVALVAVTEGAAVRGYNLLVGGGLGMTHGKGDTMAALGRALGFVAPEHAVEAVRLVAAIFRDHGNRADRRHARLKYLLAEWGVERFREEFVRRATFPLAPPVRLPLPVHHDHLGRHPQGDGQWYVGVFVQSGRIADRGTARVRTALRSIVERFAPGVVLTAQQNVLLTNLSADAVAAIEKLLVAHGVAPAETLAPVRRHSLACPALPTCGLAVAESERALPGILDRLQPELATLGVDHVPITVRMTGCPNGCARPYTADLAFVGRSLGLYHVYVGGGLAGDRMADLYLADVREPDLIDAIRPLLARWAAERLGDEGLGDYYQRALDHDEKRWTLTGRETPAAPRLGLEAAR